MKQKIDKPDAKDGWWTKFCQNMLSLNSLIDVCVWLLIVGAIFIFAFLLITATDQTQTIRHTIPAEQRQPMIEIPIERTVCVKPAEGYCMEYRTNRIRTP